MSKPTKYVNAAKFGSCEIEPTTSTYIYMLAAKSHLESFTEVPEHDLVSRIDQQLGAQLGVACDRNLFGCHSLQHILYELRMSC